MPQRGSQPSLHRSYAFHPDFPIAIVVVGICTTAAVFLRSRVAITNIAMMYLLGAIVISINCRRSVAIVSTVVGIASFYYFSVPHWNSFVIEDYNYIVILITTLTVSLVITTLTIKIRAQAAHATERETRTRAMYQLIQELSGEDSEEGAARIAARTIGETFDAEVAVYLTDERRNITRRVGLPDSFSMSEDERAIAQGILDRGQQSSNLFRDDHRVNVRYGMPLICAGSSVAAMTLVPADRNRLNEPEQMRFLEAMCSQLAAAIERLRSSNAVREAEAEIQAERTRNALLNAVSHDIKTPLASIYGAATSLIEEESRISPTARRELVESISDEAQRLNRVVNNLLEMTRLDAGLQAKKDWRPLEEIVGAALARLEIPLRDRAISTHIDDDLPWIFVDDVLLEQVFLNLLENAVKYTPAGSPIEIVAHRNGENAIISVRDHGTGLLPGEDTRVFEKFFRGRTDGARGVGLGLAICRAIVHCHGGWIAAENAPSGGAVFRFQLPIGGVPPQTSIIPEPTLT